MSGLKKVCMESGRLYGRKLFGLEEICPSLVFSSSLQEKPTKLHTIQRCFHWLVIFRLTSVLGDLCLTL